MNSDKFIDVITEQFKDQLFQLRSHAYKNHYGNNVDVSALRWNSWDDRFISLGVFEKGKLVSALRIAVVGNVEDYIKIMCTEFDSLVMDLPVAILSRAATHKNFENKGLHSLLRLHALRLIKRAEINWVAGTFKKNARRIKQLTEMGYIFEINSVPWDNFLRSHEPTFIAKLDLKTHFDKAEMRLLEKTLPIFENFPKAYDFETLVVRIKNT